MSINEIKEIINSRIGTDFHSESDVRINMFTMDDMDEEDDAEEIYNDGIIQIIISWEFGTVFINGLTDDQVKELRGSEE